MPKIFAIYPTDKQQSIRFLNKINTYLKAKLESDWHCYKVKFTDTDHLSCINIASLSESKFILFMGHGRSDKLYGSCGKKYSELVDINSLNDDEDFYGNENFITEHNINKFNNKIIFSLSCNSNQNSKKSIGRNAINKGAIGFVGFGDIPTDYEKEKNISKKTISIFKGIITRIIKQSIYISFKKNYSIENLVALIKIITCKEIQNIILSKNKNRFKSDIIKQLLSFKNEIVIMGNGHEKIC